MRPAVGPCRSFALITLMLTTGLGCSAFLEEGDPVPEPTPNDFFVGCFDGAAPFEEPPNGEVTLIIRTVNEGTSLDACLRFFRDQEIVTTLGGGFDEDVDTRAELEGGANPQVRLIVNRRPEADEPATELFVRDTFGLFQNARLTPCAPEQSYEDICVSALFPVAPAN